LRAGKKSAIHPVDEGPSSSVVKSRAQPQRVLVVEDVADLRDFYAILLRDEGYEVACACDGADALRWLSWEPDVILLDLMMPVMNGYEFYKKMRDLPGEHPPVIVVSAVAPLPNALPGIHAALPKPFDFTQLLHRVQAAAAHGPSATATAS
jgi:CheY-like chemotaxis protein